MAVDNRALLTEVLLGCNEIDHLSLTPSTVNERADASTGELPHDSMRSEVQWNRYTAPLRRLRGNRRAMRQQEDDAEPTPAEAESMQRMTFDRVYDRALMKAYAARAELHSLSSEAMHEGMTPAYKRAIAFWEAERDAADTALAAVIEFKKRLAPYAGHELLSRLAAVDIRPN